MLPHYLAKTAAVNFCLGWVQAERHRQDHWLVAAKAEGMCSCQWTDSTLNNWLIEITVCLLNGFVFTRSLFVRTSNLKANIHIVPFQFVENSYLKFLQGSVATLFRWSWKILSYFVANLSETLHINFYQNWSSIVEVKIKNFGVFLFPTCSVEWMAENRNCFAIDLSVCDDW